MRRRLVLYLWVLIFLQACGVVAFPADLPATERAPVSSATPGVQIPASVKTSQAEGEQQSMETSDRAPTVVPPTVLPTVVTATPKPVLRACLRAGGRVEVDELVTEFLPDPLVYRIYLPPCYEKDIARSYPVLYLIHGQTYTDTQWERLGVAEAADTLIATGQVRPFIIVMPRDEGWLEPGEDNFDLAVVETLVPWIDEHYRTKAEREYRSIGGLSRGAAWAAYIGLSHPDLFVAIGMHSGFIFYSKVQKVANLLEDIPEGMMPRIYIDIGNQDAPEITASATWLEQLLTSYGIPHEWHMFVGEHEESYWSAHVEDYLRWYSQGWGR